MNVLSLFDGISCGQIALERAGIVVDNYFASEIDKQAIKVTQHNYPNTVQIGDVTKIDCSLLPKIDLLLGGSPCTNFSFAGNRKGMVTQDNEEITDLARYLQLKEEDFAFHGQSYLFWEYVKILNEVKPTYFLLENVKMAKKWQKVISDTLHCEPILINSALVSAQNRNRLYWTNIPNVTQPEDKNLCFNNVIDASIIGNKDWYFKRISLKRRNVIQSIYDKKSKVLQTQSVFNPILKELFRYLTATETELLQTIPINYTSCINNTARIRTIGNGWTVDVIAHIFKELKNT